MVHLKSLMKKRASLEPCPAALLQDAMVFMESPGNIYRYRIIRNSGKNIRLAGWEFLLMRELPATN
jgi:hypothetical protein